MRYDVNEVWDPWQEELFNGRQAFEQTVVQLCKTGNLDALNRTLTDYTLKWGDNVVQKAWRLGDMLWTKYYEMF